MNKNNLWKSLLPLAIGIAGCTVQSKEIPIPTPTPNLTPITIEGKVNYKQDFEISDEHKCFIYLIETKKGDMYLVHTAIKIGGGTFEFYNQDVLKDNDLVRLELGPKDLVIPSSRLNSVYNKFGELKDFENGREIKKYKILEHQN